ncbi:MAG: hypothetical protein ACREMZ_16460 [Gemmatimonadales bacterium]
MDQSSMGTMAPLRVCTATWQPVDTISAEALACLDQSAVRALLPTGPPAEAESEAAVTVFRTALGDDVVQLTITQPTADRPSLSIEAYPSDSDHVVACDRRIAALDRGEGTPTWAALQIRGNAGCSATNEAGLTFIEWSEAGLWMHVETYLAHDDAVAWLSAWEPSE